MPGPVGRSGEGAQPQSVISAATAAQAHEFGTRLSGGRRQRIAIARAILKDAPILVMDEAVSSLDTESEQEVAAAVASVRRDRTTLIIAHRLSTILTADRIVVRESRRVAETGTHEAPDRRWRLHPPHIRPTDRIRVMMAG